MTNLGTLPEPTEPGWNRVVRGRGGGCRRPDHVKFLPQPTSLVLEISWLCLSTWLYKQNKTNKKSSAQGRSLFRAFFSLLFRGCFSKLFFFVACKDNELRNWLLFLLCILLRKQLMDKSMQPFLFSMRIFSLPTYECFFSCLCVRAYVCMCYSLWSLRHQVILLVMDCVIVKTFFMLLSTH